MKQKNLKKAYEITDAKIQFVSLVDKAANRKRFLITKAEDGQAEFTTFGRIIKADAKTHYVTGVVYEPMVEDAQGNFMTEDEITKACYWFTKNGSQVDLQHSFEPLQDAQVVENWIEKADTEIEGQQIKKGTWLMTVEVADDKVWQGIQKGEITGFSMGGLGNYSEEDTNLANVQKDDKKSLLKQIADELGFNVVEKGKVKEAFSKSMHAEAFWKAWEALEETIKHYDYMQGGDVYEDDERKIRDALNDFDDIITQLLTGEEPILKALHESQPAEQPIEKVGRELSGRNKKTLQSIYESLGAFLEEFPDDEKNDEKVKPIGGDDNPDSEKMKAKKNPEEPETQKEPGGEGTDAEKKPKVNEDESETEEEGEEEESNDDKKSIKKGEHEVTIEECEELVTSSIKKAIAEVTGQEIEKADDEEVTAEEIQKMVTEAVRKAAKPKEDYVTPEQVQDIVAKAVSESIEPLLQQRGLPTSLNDTIKKDEKQKSEHYLHGIL